MHIFLDNFYQDEKYSAKLASHEVELRREEIFPNICLSISSLQTDYLNLDSSSGCGKNGERANIVQEKYNFCVGANNSAEKCFKDTRKEKKKYSAAGGSDNRRTERIPRKCFICGSEDHLIAKCPKAIKDNKK